MAELPPEGGRPAPSAAPLLVPLRLLVHFQITTQPLVQVTEALREGARLSGAGTRALDLGDPTAELELRDPRSGSPTGERVTIEHVIKILYSLARRHS